VLISTDDPAAAEQFRAIPRVESVERTANNVVVRGIGEDLVTQVIQCVADHRMHVTDFRTEVPTLEDVFLRLTGHTMRD
jgi:ABC-2 type transport system ATP-binding protein